jgi:hypothetical protein
MVVGVKYLPEKYSLVIFLDTMEYSKTEEDTLFLGSEPCMLIHT